MSITGNLRTLEFAELLQWLSQGQKTGCLVIKSASAEKRIYFKRGKIVSSESDNPEEHLGKYMVREGLLDQETLSRAIKLQESTQILLGKVLVTLGTISEEELHRILRRKTEESLYELFNWTEGDFRFVPDELPKLPMVPLEIDVTNVVLEGAKRLDEARRDGRVGTGDYGTEIEEVLSSEIFQGVEVTEDPEESTPAAVETPVEQEIEALSVTARDTADEEPSAEVRGYYSGSTRTTKGRTPLLAAAAAIAAIGIGIAAFFVMRPDPAVGVSDRQALARSTPALAESLELDAITGTDVALDADLEAIEEPQATDAVAEVSAAEKAEIQARYEAELQALKQQLEQAQLAAAERDQALGRVAELEEQVAKTSDTPPVEEQATTPAAKFTVASLQNPLESATFTAGGDELPPFLPPQPTTGADQEAGSEFAAEMVESASPSRSEPEPEVTPETTEVSPPFAPAEQPAVEDPISHQVTAPVLLTQPKPRYPVAALRMGKEAVVNLRLLIDENGAVADVERIGPEQGMGFDKAAINAARRTEWQPGTRNGEPVEMWAKMRIAFKP